MTEKTKLIETKFQEKGIKYETFSTNKPLNIQAAENIAHSEVNKLFYKGLFDITVFIKD